MKSIARQRGWSLLELAVVIVIMGILGTVVWRMLPAASQVARGDMAGDALVEADQALAGFLLANNRLPAADTDGDGRENAGATSGSLPYRTLGSRASRLRYAVSPTLAIAAAVTFSPLLPSDVPTEAPNNGVAYAHKANGLDLCLALASLQSGAGGMKLDGNVSAAYALDMPAAPGNEAPAPEPVDFPLPGTAAAIGRRVLAVGPGELAVRLQCPDRVARTLAAARAAYAAYDMRRFADSFLATRQFTAHVADTNQTFATINIVMNSFDIALGTAIEVFAIGLDVVGWPPASGVAFAVVAHAAAALGLGLSGYNMSVAKANLDQAQAQVKDEAAQLDAATANDTEAKQRYADAYYRLRMLDEAGLNP